jgi:ketosteroid isomerase-like protein
MTEKDLAEEVRQFLAAYDAAFQTFDGTRIAPFYHAPCVTVRGDGSIHSFQTRPDIERFFGEVAQKYRADGLHGGTFYDLDVIPIGSRSLLATVTWEQWRADKSVLRKWRQSYNLVQTEAGWQILAATFHLN